MKVLFCTTSFDRAFTGSGRFARTVVRGLSAGKDIRLFVLSEDVSDSEEEHCVFRHCTVGYHVRLPFIGYAAKSKSYARAVARLHDREHFDVIFFNNVWLGASAVNTLTISSVKTLGFIHDDNALTCDRQKSWKRRWAFARRRRLESAAAGLMDRILTNSAYMQNTIAQSYGIEPDKIEILRLAFINYSDTSFRYTPIEKGEEIKVLFVKHDYKRGGLKEMLLALTSIRDHRFAITVIGISKSTLEKMIKHHLRESKHIRIHFAASWQPHENVLRFMRECHILCAPARQEALGVTIAEALAHGMRVVTTDVGGIPEVTGNGSYAFVAPPGNIDAMTSAIRLCIENEEEASNRAEAGRKHVIRRFDMDEMINDLIRIMQSVQ